MIPRTSAYRIPILIMIRSFDRGGTEQHLAYILSRLNPDRFRVRVATLYPQGTLLQAFRGTHIEMLALPDASRAARLLAFGRIVRRERLLLLHCFLPESYLLFGSTGVLCGAAACIMSRRSRNHYQSRHPIAAWVERRLHRRMDALLGNSRVVIQDLLDEGAPPDRVRLIYNGIDTDRFPVREARIERRLALRAELGLSDDRVVLTCAANLFPYKGHADLLDALALLGAGFTARATLLLVGRDAGTRAELEVQAARLGLSAAVRFLGERDDVADLLAASDIGVLASHEEGFSNAVIEGMAAGLPMVVSDVGGNAEAVTDGECGYVVPARDPSSLAQALADLLSDAGRRQAMGEAGHRRVTASFSLDACVAAYESLYEELWDRHAAEAHPS